MIPYMGIALFLNLSGMWADQLRSRGVMGTAAARKIMNTIGKNFQNFQYSKSTEYSTNKDYIGNLET